MRQDKLQVLRGLSETEEMTKNILRPQEISLIVCLRKHNFLQKKHITQ